MQGTPLPLPAKGPSESVSKDTLGPARTGQSPSDSVDVASLAVALVLGPLVGLALELTR